MIGEAVQFRIFFGTWGQISSDCCGGDEAGGQTPRWDKFLGFSSRLELELTRNRVGISGLGRIVLGKLIY